MLSSPSRLNISAIPRIQHSSVQADPRSIVDKFSNFSLSSKVTRVSEDVAGRLMGIIKSWLVFYTYVVVDDVAVVFVFVLGRAVVVVAVVVVAVIFVLGAVMVVLVFGRLELS